MPLLGAMAAFAVRAWIEAWSHWAAFALVTFVGVKLVRDSFSSGEDRIERDSTRGLSLILLSTAVSIDALAVGFTLGLADISILRVVSVIGLVLIAII